MSIFPRVILIEISSWIINLVDLREFIIATKIINPLKMRKYFSRYINYRADMDEAKLTGPGYGLLGFKYSDMYYYRPRSSGYINIKIFNSIPLYSRWLKDLECGHLYPQDPYNKQDFLEEILKRTNLYSKTNIKGQFYLYYKQKDNGQIYRAKFYMANKLIVCKLCISFYREIAYSWVNNNAMAPVDIQFLESKDIDIISQFYPHDYYVNLMYN